MSEPSATQRQPILRLTVPLVVADRSVTVGISGDLTAETAAVVRLHLLSLACEDGPAEIVLDLSGVTWMDQAGAEVLSEASHLQLLRASVLRLSSASASLTDLLKAQPDPANSPFVKDAPVNHLRVLVGDIGEEFPVGEVAWNATIGIGSDDEQVMIASLRVEVDHLKDALAKRDLIGQAKGVIGVLYACDQAAAFAVLKRLSMNTNRRLHEVCTLLVLSATQQEHLPNDLADQLRAAAPEDVKWLVRARRH